ncbi:hypothetical protein WK09_12380 [Burkholderia ubonensis]|uniref:hypothetical protein n=1 Tax=Burkholderia ubonensis TaxID=101571 RepID=UPI00075A9EB6|nr:hypothetical protein [Burkholderia ubonensis]KVQ91461.1 hypothetical protein WK09_12380 [Burkholderia ubonensis]KVW36067.1 hypothetical protein WK93_28095 [Burkholderia ubonensis]KWC08811.1 hypothetical protein WL43_13255 [Burkholderia ubonensis]OJB24979.1 hypothetical protein BGV54_08125 [Burkholderia ubonensis]
MSVIDDLLIKMYGEIAMNPDAPFEERHDALRHIALRVGAISAFRDSKGVRHVSPRILYYETVDQLIKWEKEDGVTYLPEHIARPLKVKRDPDQYSLKGGGGTGALKGARIGRRKPR